MGETIHEGPMIRTFWVSVKLYSAHRGALYTCLRFKKKKKQTQFLLHIIITIQPGMIQLSTRLNTCYCIKDGEHILNFPLICPSTELPWSDLAENSPAVGHEHPRRRTGALNLTPLEGLAPAPLCHKDIETPIRHCRMHTTHLNSCKDNIFTFSSNRV